MPRPEVKKNYTLTERVYLIEILKGMGITIRHFIQNFIYSFRKGPHTIPTTWQYPEDRRPISPVYRGEHVLVLDSEGRELCVGCGMCAKVCPAGCITVEMAKVPEEHANKYAGKTYSKKFEIDLLRCIFCGFCEEICPKNALQLSQKYELARYTKEECILNKEKLIQNYHKALKKNTLKKIQLTNQN